MSGAVVHVKKAKYDIYIGRPSSANNFEPSILGNKFHIGPHGTREQVIAKYENYARERMRQDPAFRAAVAQCHGRRLGCWCAPLACHGDVLLKLAAEIKEGKC